MLRSIVVVIGSYLLSVALVFATNPLLSAFFPDEFAAGHVPSHNALLMSTALFGLVSIVCAGVCTLFSRTRQLSNVFWFFLLGEVLGVAASIANWGNGWPHWYALSWDLCWPVGCCLGYLIAARAKKT